MAWSKESRHSRGYGNAWEKIRKAVIKRDGGMCQECRRGGRVVAGRDVDHVVSKAKAKAMGWTDEQIDSLDNLELKCHLCHKIKTAAEQGRTYRPKATTGLDGWPIDGD